MIFTTYSDCDNWPICVGMHSYQDTAPFCRKLFFRRYPIHPTFPFPDVQLLLRYQWIFPPGLPAVVVAYGLCRSFYPWISQSELSRLFVTDYGADGLFSSRSGSSSSPVFISSKVFPSGIFLLNISIPLTSNLFPLRSDRRSPMRTFAPLLIFTV